MWDGENWIWVAILVALFLVNYILNAWFARTSEKCNEKGFGFLGILPLGWVGKSCLTGGHEFSYDEWQFWKYTTVEFFILTALTSFSLIKGDTKWWNAIVGIVFYVIYVVLVYFASKSVNMGHSFGTGEPMSQEQRAANNV